MSSGGPEEVGHLKRAFSFYSTWTPIDPEKKGKERTRSRPKLTREEILNFVKLKDRSLEKLTFGNDVLGYSATPVTWFEVFYLT